MRKFLCLILAVLMFVPIIVSCSDKGDDSGAKDTSSNGGQQDTESDTEEEILYPKIPAGTNFNGYKFRVLTKGKSVSHWMSMDIFSEELNGNAINDAVFERNSTVEALLNIKIVEIPVANYFNQGAEVSISVLAQADEYDMLSLKPEGVVSSFINNNYIQNLKNFDTMDLSMPWYDQNSIKGMSIGNQIYLVMGDLLTMDDDATGAVFFNKKIAENNKMGNFYTLVEEGKWTLDKMYELAAAGIADLNGNGTRDLTDQWGALSEFAITFSLASGGGETMIVKNSDDIPVSNAMNEKYINILEKVLKIQNDWDITLYAEKITGYSDVWVQVLDKAFQEDRALFYIAWLNRASLFREMETDFGIIPMPKYDESQKDYYSFVHMYCANSITIPSTVSDTDKIGLIIEVLSAESKKVVTPAYYEKSLKSRGARDEESSKMLDIIFANRIYDLGYMYNWGGIFSAVGGMAGIKNGGISGYASKIASVEKNINRAIEKTLEAVGA